MKKYISSVISKFINSIINSGEYNEQDYGVVIDVCQLMPEDYVKNINNDTLFDRENKFESIIEDIKNV